jgi:signal transduction histidine kinase
VAPRLFERFYRGPGGGEGSGLGLAIAQELAQRMGGRLVLGADAHGRKEFLLTLPAAATPAVTPTTA